MWTFLAIVFSAFVIIYAIYSFSCELYSRFDHSTLPSVPLKKESAIADIKTEKVIYLKNGGKLKTQVIFNDGFIFTTFRTNREDRFLSYKISIDNELANTIIEKAILAHDKAYAKQNK